MLYVCVSIGGLFKKVSSRLPFGIYREITALESMLMVHNLIKET